ncbi:hypothetical protein BD309DRAFT_986578 [Dichomitus squalens]|nr:hypothetical protein BD309DRAFT_986578 [Dichomitus squalens]
MAPQVRFNSFGIPYLVEFANVTFRPRSRKASRSSRSGSVTPTASMHKPSFDSRPSFDSTSTSSKASLDVYSHSRPILNIHPSVHLNRASSRLSFESDWTFATASSETLAAAAPPKSMAKGRAQHKRDPKLAPVPTPPFSPISPILATEPRIVIESEIDTRGQEGEREGQGLLIRFASQAAQPPRKLSEHRLARLKYRIAKAVMAAGMHTSPSPEFGVDDNENAGTPRESYASIGSIYSDEVEQSGLPGSLFRGTYGQVMNALHGAGLTASPCKESGLEYATCVGALFVAHQNAYGGVDFTKLTLWA